MEWEVRIYREKDVLEGHRMARTHRCQIFHQSGQDKRHVYEDQNELPVRELRRVL